MNECGRAGEAGLVALVALRPVAPRPTNAVQCAHAAALVPPNACSPGSDCPLPPPLL